MYLHGCIYSNFINYIMYPYAIRLKTNNNDEFYKLHILIYLYACIGETNSFNKCVAVFLKLLTTS